MIESDNLIVLGICELCLTSNILENTEYNNKILGLCQHCKKLFNRGFE